MLSWGLLGALRGQVLRVPEEGPALLGSLGSLCPEKRSPRQRSEQPCPHGVLPGADGRQV